MCLRRKPHPIFRTQRQDFLGSGVSNVGLQSALFHLKPEKKGSLLLKMPTFERFMIQRCGKQHSESIIQCSFPLAGPPRLVLRDELVKRIEQRSERNLTCLQ